MSKDNVLEISDFNVDFWVDGVWYPAVIDMNLGLAAGKVTAIVGESGSGKSTTALGLMSLLASNARMDGSVKVKGEEMLNAKTSVLRQFRGKEVAYIFQEPMTALNPLYTIGFQIVETLRSHFDMGPKEAHTRALELITLVDIPNPEQSILKYPHQLSGGQRQRAMIAQAPDMADDILVMKDGITVEHGTADQIFNNPKHPYTQQLLGAVPKLGSTKKRALPYSESAKPAPVLKLSDVTIEYPKRGRQPAFTAVKNFNLEIYPGEIVGLVGESGSGKTTVGRASIGLLPVKGGSIEIVGKEIAGAGSKQLSAIRQHTGIVFQDPASSLNPRLPIGESIGEPLYLAGLAKGADLARKVEELLDQVELPRSYRNRYPHELSGGQRQRVGIARALALTPDLLIADEPTSALDVSVQARFLELLQELQGKLNFACLFISHDLAVVDILSHRIAVMQNGLLVEEGDRDQILKNPKNDYTKRLISAVPVPDPKEQKIRREARLATKK